MKAYILKGIPREVEKVLQENRLRVDRGVIEFTPCQPDPAVDMNLAALQEGLRTAEAEYQRMASAQMELAGIAGEVVSIAVDGGQTIPEELSTRLAEFGIIVPKIGETADNTAETGENPTESVPKTEEMDDKYVSIDDLQEANIDADVKDSESDDSKEVKDDDTKEPDTTKKTSKRSKKTE